MVWFVVAFLFYAVSKKLYNFFYIYTYMIWKHIETLKIYIFSPTRIYPIALWLWGRWNFSKFSQFRISCIFLAGENARPRARAMFNIHVHRRLIQRDGIDKKKKKKCTRLANVTRASLMLTLAPPRNSFSRFRVARVTHIQREPRDRDRERASRVKGGERGGILLNSLTRARAHADWSVS